MSLQLKEYKTTQGEIILYNPNIPNQDVLSADNFFINEKGEYIFDISKEMTMRKDNQ